MKKAILTLGVVLVLGAGLTACTSDADVASRNLSKEADNFQVPRRIVFYNGITDKYILEITGLCALGNADDPGEVTVTCKTGKGEYKKHFLGLSDNVTYVVEQLQGVSVSDARYEVNFKPSTVVPDVKVR